MQSQRVATPASSHAPTRGACRMPNGFTLMEIVVGMVVAATAILVALALAGSMTGQMLDQRERVVTQENVRIALEDMTRILRSAGSGVDHSLGQGRFIYAGPYTIGMNVNMLPLDDPTGAGTPAALDPNFSAATIPLANGQSYTPPRKFTGGAETLLLTFDSNRDGLLTADDASDDPEEDSDNPHDVVLKLFSYGSNGSANVVTSSGLALLRGPLASDGAKPLFSYWIDTDNNAATPPLLHGDSNRDGALSNAEIAALTAVAADQVALIERIDLTAVAETERQVLGGGYKSTTLRSSVSFRNRNSTAARIAGTVFHDADGDGIRGPAELPLRDVIVRCSNGHRARSGRDGRYVFSLSPGTYSIQEIDPAGFQSTTSNTVAVTVGPGEYVEVNFGDSPSLSSGRIRAVVFNDANQNAQFDDGELPIRGVRVFLDNGAELDTDPMGVALFTVAIGSYTVTAVDSTSYSSSSPNVVDVNVTTTTDTIEVSFADFRLGDSGTIHGVVFHDEDNDGQRDPLENGVPNVTITLDEVDIAVTNSAGEFQFTAAPGTHVVTETDPAGYTSSTVNTFYVDVVVNATVEVAFGDIAQEDITFQDITLANTERALCIATLETGEDNKSDLDFVLGTHYVSSANDVLVWWNQRNNSSTPNASLFTSTPSYSRVVDSDVNSIRIVDLNNDGRGDVLAAQGAGSNNISVWLMQGTGSNKGKLPTTPTVRYTASLATQVNDLVIGHFDEDSRIDFAVGTTTGAGTGKLEIWHGGGGSDFSRDSDDIYPTLPGSSIGLGEVVALAAGDFDGDGSQDLALGCRVSSSASVIHVLRFDRERNNQSDFETLASIPIAGQIQDLLALELYEDDQNDIDLVVAIETASTAGLVQVWHNWGDGSFGFGETPNVAANDVVDPGGSPLSLAAARVDNDIFPDVIVGTRNGSAFTGSLILYRAYGYLPATGTVISTTGVGEVVTVTTGDLNRDGAPDIAVGTRSSSSIGRVILYFNVRPSI